MQLNLNITQMGSDGQNAVATWHKFPNPGGAISTKNVIFPIQGAQFYLTKNVLFPTQGAGF